MSTGLVVVFFFYGLAFFSMGLLVAVEGRRISDQRLQHALRPLAAFGMIHGAHEWYEMFQGLELLPGQNEFSLLWDGFRITILAFSFLSLAACGSSLLSRTVQQRRLSLLVPLAMAAIWGFGILVFKGKYASPQDVWDAADVWTRYVLAIPGALMASIGLVVQQREFRKAGMARFGQDSLWAAISFAWYGVIGQVFTRPSLLWPSTILNSHGFAEVFGFPVQLLRASVAVVASVFVVRFLRASEVEIQQQIDELNEARVLEAEKKEALRRELLKRVVAAQEAERQRIARELHDETGQSLTAIGLGLRGIATTVRVDVDRAAGNLRNIEALAVSSLDELRRLIADLRPSHLDDLGLPATLRWYAGEVQTRTGIKVDVTISGGECDMTPEATITMFRIAQEALTNIIKHANSKNVEIHLDFGQKDVALTVRDDGKGFNATRRMLMDRAWGLLGMEERAGLLNGNFSIKSAPGKGTEVKVTIPCHQKPKDLLDEEDKTVISG